MRLGLLLLAFPVAALACDRIEYAEVRDWSPDKIEHAYCVAMRDHENRMDLWKSLRGAGELSTAKSREIMAESQTCLDQAGLMYRTLENLHHRKPVCR